MFEVDQPRWFATDWAADCEASSVSGEGLALVAAVVEDHAAWAAADCAMFSCPPVLRAGSP